MYDPDIFPPRPVNPAEGQARLHDFLSLYHGDTVSDMNSLLDQRQNRDVLLAVFANSPYLSRLMTRDPAFVQQLLATTPDQLFDQIMQDLNNRLPDITDRALLGKTLRQAKAHIALLIAWADLAGWWPLSRVVQALTAFAELAVSLTVSHLLRAAMKTGDLGCPTGKSLDRATLDLAQGSGYVVLAMGKMGGYELNYSSDIDLIVLYDDEILPWQGRKTAQDFCIHLTRDLVKILQERTAEGYVFRTDLRLRPDPGATAVALSMSAAELYYQSMGLNWERAAMIKARPVAGDLAAGHDFLGRIRHFVWRSHLDYAALEDIYDIKKLIHSHHGHQKIGFGGQDIKLGHGGIREIEFYAQIFQLIAGGREPALQVAPTCDALNALAQNGKISARDNKALQTAYVYYRTLEHRLQMIEDEQTHSLPLQPAELDRITAFMGYTSLATFQKNLGHHLQTVHDLFSNLLKNTHQEESSPTAPLIFATDRDHKPTLDFIKKAGYKNPKAIYGLISIWLRGRYRACRTERARHLLHALIPDILTGFSRLPDPDTALAKFDKFLSGLPSGIQLFSFIKAQPWLLELLADIIGMAPRLADHLAKKPFLLDAVLNSDFFEDGLNADQLTEQLNGQLGLAQDFQDILDISRRWLNDHKFQVGVQILRHNKAAHKARHNLSLLADVTLRVLYDKTRQHFAKKHGDFPGSAFAVLALGKLGGHEMSTSSDVDLVFIYDGPTEAGLLSDGPRPLSLNHYFARFSQAYINGLTALTSEGQLYEVDMRLRPSGNTGPIAVTLKSFQAYQTQQAWTWEHLALTRGRVVFGDCALQDAIQHVIRGALDKRGRDVDVLRRDTAAMREKLRKNFGTDDIWAIKHVKGGLVDIEFICQYLILKQAAQNSKLQNSEILVPNSLDQITVLKASGILEPVQADQLYTACDFLQNLQLVLRLCLDQSTPKTDMSETLVSLLCNRLDAADLAQLRRKIRTTQKEVYHLYQQIISDS